MSNDLRRINTQIKDAMRRFIMTEDETYLHSIIELVKERRKVIIHQGKPNSDILTNK